MSGQPPEPIDGTIRVQVENAGPRGWIERRATVDDSGEQIVVGASPAWYGKYGVDDGQFPVRTTTNDLFAAAVVSCLTGTLASALDARRIYIGPETIEAEATTSMGPADDDCAWIVRSIDVTFHLRVPRQQRPAAERAVATFHKSCLLSQTLTGSRCEITTTAVFRD